MAAEAGGGVLLRERRPISVPTGRPLLLLSPRPSGPRSPLLVAPGGRLAAAGAAPFHPPSVKMAPPGGVARRRGGLPSVKMASRGRGQVSNPPGDRGLRHRTIARPTWRPGRWAGRGAGREGAGPVLRGSGGRGRRGAGLAGEERGRRAGPPASGDPGRSKAAPAGKVVPAASRGGWCWGPGRRSDKKRAGVREGGTRGEGRARDPGRRGDGEPRGRGGHPVPVTSLAERVCEPAQPWRTTWR